MVSRGLCICTKHTWSFVKLDLIFQSAKILLRVLRECFFFTKLRLCLVCFVDMLYRYLLSSNVGLVVWWNGGSYHSPFDSRRQHEDCGGCPMAEKCSKNGQAVWPWCLFFKSPHHHSPSSFIDHPKHPPSIINDATIAAFPHGLFEPNRSMLGKSHHH